MRARPAGDFDKSSVCVDSGDPQGLALAKVSSKNKRGGACKIRMQCHSCRQPCYCQYVAVPNMLAFTGVPLVVLSPLAQLFVAGPGFRVSSKPQHTALFGCCCAQAHRIAAVEGREYILQTPEEEALAAAADAAAAAPSSGMPAGGQSGGEGPASTNDCGPGGAGGTAGGTGAPEVLDISFELPAGLIGGKWNAPLPGGWTLWTSASSCSGPGA
jgi:hypothetical protein